MDPSTVGVIQCGASGMAPHGLPEALLNGSYRQIIEDWAIPFMDAGGRTIALHNPHGVSFTTEGEQYRFCGGMLGVVPSRLAQAFPDEWGPLVDKGLDLRVYLGPLATDPNVGQQLSRAMQHIGAALAPYLFRCSVIYHDAIAYYAARSRRNLDLFHCTAAAFSAHTAGAGRTGVEGPVLLPELADYPMFCAERDWQSYGPGLSTGEIVRWVRDVPPSEIPAGAAKVLSDKHRPAIDLPGLGRKAWSQLP